MSLALHDAAVVIPTTLRPSLARAVRSVFRQSGVERVQVLIGVDQRLGDGRLLATLAHECPPHVTLTTFDPGYSTAQAHGGLYPNTFGGALRTILSYAAHSRYVAYLDDDDWWADDHLSGLLAAIQGRAWAFSYRWLVDHMTEQTLCRDEWDSVGPGRGINQESHGGFCCPSTLMLDINSCHGILPWWSQAGFDDGSGEDRLIFRALKPHPWGASNLYSCYYTMRAEVQAHPHHAEQFAARGIKIIPLP